jgi:hypothetical protein
MSKRRACFPLFSGDSNMSFDDFVRLRDHTETHLENVSDLTMMVLKGHLLIEQALYSAIKALVPHPTFIDSARFRFPQLVDLARALLPANKDEKRAKLEAMMWDAFAALNTIRNKIAHDLEPSDLQALLRRLHVTKLDVQEPFSDPETINAVGITVSAFIGILMGRVHTLIEARN